MKNKSLFAVFSAAVISLGIGGCSGKNPAAEATQSETPSLSVYASTNVWASLAKEITGDKVSVSTSLTDPAQDPHDYQASAKDKKLINDASVVIVNGGGYDDWAKQLVDSAPVKPYVINAVNLSGKLSENDLEHDHDADHDHDDADHDHDDHDDADHDHAKEENHHHHHHHGDFNEHVFYDLETAQVVAEHLAEHLAEKDKNNAQYYKDNYQAVSKKLDELEEKADHVGHEKDLKALVTEPVAGYLLEKMDIKDITPKEFIVQSETESGPSVKVQAQTLELLEKKTVQLLVLNVQTEDPVSEKLAEAAQAAQIPVVKVSETLPRGVQSYIQWMQDNIKQIEDALK